MHKAISAASFCDEYVGPCKPTHPLPDVIKDDLTFNYIAQKRLNVKASGFFVSSCLLFPGFGKWKAHCVNF